MTGLLEILRKKVKKLPLDIIHFHHNPLLERLSGKGIHFMTQIFGLFI